MRAESPKGPGVSKIKGKKMYRFVRDWYLFLFAFSTCCAADPACKAHEMMLVSVQVASQKKHLLLLNGKTAILSGLLSSPLSSPAGSRMDGVPALYSALFIILRAECLRNRPALTVGGRA